MAPAGRFARSQGSLQGASDPSVCGGSQMAGSTSASSTTGKSPAVAVSDDKGQSWKNLYDVGAQVGVVNAVFPGG